ncbi:MAG: hypothetical protein KF896_14040 [Ignavibacteriae bacterium]|nr:hypothetical protein [Ignavibacteriota bacterium]
MEVTRQGYIGKEKDVENNLGDHGVRKYDDKGGRFNSIDPLWEKYFGWTPYQYCMNNPIWAKDWDGKIIMSKEDQAKFSRTATIVYDFMPTLADNDRFMKAMKKATGASIRDIKNALKGGNPPFLNLDRNFYGAHGMTSSSDKIGVNTFRAKELERKEKTKLDVTTEVQTLFMISIVSHELAQALESGAGFNKTGHRNPGEVFDKLFHGVVVTSEHSVRDNFDKMKEAYGDIPKFEGDTYEDK